MKEDIFLTTIQKIDKVASLLASHKSRNNETLNGNEYCCKEMISALSFYLCQILENNYYTETYLIDQYQDFEEFMHLFKRKKDLVANLSVYFQTRFQLSGAQAGIKVRIFIDNVWSIESESSWTLKVIDGGDYSRLTNKNLYCGYEIIHDHDLIEMYKEIKLEFQSEESIHKKIHEDISRYINTIGPLN